MNRLEMFVELKKDNTKVFREILGGVEYYVEEGNLMWRKGNSCGKDVEVIGFNDGCHYQEVVKPYCEVIETSEVYWFVDFKEDDHVEWYTYHKDDIDERYRKQGNMFRTKEEAIEAGKKMLEAIK